ncbi:hypothetical protein DVW05_06150 [Clostridium botulinum]|uniref:hypothetical protein n=1 Tax=Clostridium sp. ZBS18 TaxID=2949967 RepID=UPI001D23FFE4|nr:hypothetical protein [Clostridium sp. ZBS18]MBN1054931.1 hypothetical protein [Clostridium botulinum]
MEKSEVIAAIRKHFLEYGYNELLRMEKVFDCIYESSEEIYYIKFYRQAPNFQQIKNIELENIYPIIIKMSNNNKQKYNMNFIICCDLKDNYQEILGIERDQINCRKIFINTENVEKFEEDLMILPFTKIKQHFNIQNSLDNIMKRTIDKKIVELIFNEDTSLEVIKDVFLGENK